MINQPNKPIKKMTTDNNNELAEAKRTVTERLFTSVVQKAITKLNAIYPAPYAEQEEVMKRAIAKRTKVEEPWQQQRQKVLNLEAELQRERIVLQEIEEQTKIAVRRVDEWQHQAMCEALQRIAPIADKLTEDVTKMILDRMREKKMLFEGDVKELISLKAQVYAARTEKGNATKAANAEAKRTTKRKKDEAE